MVDDLRSAALEYANQGIAIMPCAERGKKPALDRTGKEHAVATNDTDQILQWWTKKPTIQHRYRVHGERGLPSSTSTVQRVSSGYETTSCLCHDVGAASDLFVQSFLGVVGPDLPPVGLGEPGEDQDLCCGTVEVLPRRRGDRPGGGGL